MGLFNQFFLSVKWKVALLFGALLLLFNTGFLIVTYQNKIGDMNSTRDHLQRQFKHDLTNEITRSSIELQRLATLMLLPDSSLSVRKYFITISQLLEKNRKKLEEGWHISHAQYLDATGNLLAGWGDKLPSKIQNHIPSVINRGVAKAYIHCEQACFQFQLIPILINKQVDAILVIASSLTNTLSNFTQKTGADIAILSKKQHNRNLSSEHFIPEWNMELHTLSAFEKNRPYLSQLAKKYNSYAIKTDQIIRNNESVFKLLKKEISPIEFQFIRPKQDKTYLFIILDDISEYYQDIIDTTYQNFLFSVISMLLMALGFIFFSSKPLARLSLIAKALPLIAQQEYQEAKALLQKRGQKKGIEDEFSQLEKSAIELTSQHENLYASIREHTIALSKRGEELQQERDFVQSLINTAKMLIITLDAEYKITSFNHFSEEITGYLSSEIIHSSFEQLFPSEQWSETKEILTHLNTSEQTLDQQESEVINHITGDIYIISWLFSSLNHLADDSVILAVGLDITEKKRSDEHIIWLAEHDVLTELYNRRKFNSTFEQLLNNAKRFNHRGALLFLDLDHFKDVNDRYGHKAGDHVLKHVADTLMSLSRTTDSVARLGGDEFAILLPETDEKGAINFAQKIINSFSQMNIYFNNENYAVTTSIGIVQYPMANQTIEELLGNADIAMYQAKAKGKNTWHLFNVNDSTRVQMESRVFWKQQIENALANNRFVLHYQPIIDIKSEAIHHYEVLVRMMDENHTLHMPAEFIDIAEQTGLIHSIDHFVIKNSIKLQAELEQVNADILLSVNLSSAAITDTVLVPLLKRLLQDNHTQADGLMFELSETDATENVIQARDFMELLNSLGYRFSLDNVGKERATYHSLQELPIDLIKIDGSYIVNLTKNENDRAFVKSLVATAKGMGKKTVAEFVQNAETLALLKSMGVDFAQGYYIGKPKPYFVKNKPLTQTNLRSDPAEFH